VVPDLIVTDQPTGRLSDCTESLSIVWHGLHNKTEILLQSNIVYVMKLHCSLMKFCSLYSYIL
jgi:hypothetical protein